MQRGNGNFLTRLAALVLALLLVPVMAQFAFAAEEPVCYEHGDVNGDGKVDSRDAIRALYHSVFGDEKPEYAVNQDCDFNGDGNVDKKDAVFVLYSTLGIFDGYELEGTVHNYYDPQWTWNDADATASVTFKCGCGKEHTPAQVKVEKTKDVAATCVQAGKVEYAISVVFEGKTYETTKVLPTLPKGHSLTGTLSCTEGVECENCDYEIKALGHALVLDKITEATCQTQEVRDYHCAVCGETESVTLEGLADHAYVQGEETHMGGCLYHIPYACGVCGKEDESQTQVLYKHTYTASLTKEANCRETGVMTYACACGDSYTEEIPTNDSHSWVEGETKDGVTSYSCACGATKTAKAVNANAASVAKEELANTELQLKDEEKNLDVAISLDEDTLKGLGDTVDINVDTVAVEDLVIADDAKAQIGENTVYDFSMASGEEQVSQFDGKVTITLPYTLQEGDDVECIDVWFISDDGEVTCVMGTYSNGYVTFTTDHFSYYTVTRLTPKQRCEHYGHAMGYSKVEATCTAEGHDKAFCQRCGYEEKNEKLDIIPHDYTETTTAATCTTAGYYEKICKVCKQKVSGDLPASGHLWVLDEENSSEASCTAAGKKVYNCSECGASYTEELPQLEHELALMEEVTADCTNKGYRVQVCSLCGEEFTDKEVAPLGHKYTAQWVWEEDYLTATLLLKCENDDTHNQEIGAVVTKSTDATDACKGIAKFTATVAYNGTTYTDEQTVELDEAIHNTGKWETTASEHYHTCANCGEKVDAAAHSWGTPTVTKEPTCSDKGSQEVLCVVCGYKKTESIAATGKHTYVKGVCSVCGHEEGSCKHYAFNSKDVDLSGFDICEGAWATAYFCDCGENTYYEWNLRCSFGEETSYEGTLPNGKQATIWKSVCEDCGLVREEGSCMDVDVETCMAKEYSWVKLSKDGKTVLESENIMGFGQHWEGYRYSKEDLAEKGIPCGGTAHIHSCACGERQWIEIETNCSWVHDAELSEQTGKDISVCSTCGVTRSYDHTYEEFNCGIAHKETHAFTLNGKELCSYVNAWTMTDHDYRVASYTMLGDSCTDGVEFVMVCSRCGETNESWTMDHFETVGETIDISAGGYCNKIIYKNTCFCGEVVSLGTDGGCNMVETGYDEKTDTYYYACQTCGLQRARREVRGEMDENCQGTITYYTTYIGKDGKVLAEGKTFGYYTAHEYESSIELVEGATSCEDGVRTTETCKNCGYSYSYTNYGHRSQAIETYNLSGYGMCGGKITKYSCLCGENQWLERTDVSCSWNWIEGGNGYQIQQCPECKTIRHRVYTQEKLENCQTHEISTETYKRDDEVLFQIHYDQTWTSHTLVYEFALQNAEQGCDGGYTVTRNCIKCGYSQTDEEIHYGHERWRVGYAEYGEGQLCGSIIVNSYSCACGENQNSEWGWSEVVCNSDDEYYSEELDCWIEKCSICGVERIGDWENVKNGCERTESSKQIFRKNGEELFTIETSNKYESHDYLCSFTMLDEALGCDGGYTVHGVCADCGEETEFDQIYYGCDEGHLTKKQVLFDGEGFCGEISIHFYNCACGAYSYTGTNSMCNFDNGTYDEELDRWFYTCTQCGLEESRYSNETRIPGTCTANVVTNYMYRYNGEILAQGTYERVQTSHRNIFSFNMQGDTCEDGYTTSYVCKYCGKGGANDRVRYTHENYQTAYYDLSDYGMCGGEIWQHQCACGKSANWSWNNDCNWEWVSDENGVQQEYCEKCDTYRYYTNESFRDKETCTQQGEARVEYVRDGVTVLAVDLKESNTAHDFYFTFNLYGEDCEDGYTVTNTCKDCGYTFTEEEVNYDHNSYRSEHYELSEYGMCGGYLRNYVCACGKYFDRTFNEQCDWTWIDEDENGVEKHYCEDCGTYRFYDSERYYDKENCVYNEDIHVTYVRDDVTLLDVVLKHNYEQHEYEYTFNMQGESCEDGYTVTGICENCGESMQDEQIRYNHASYETEYYDLSEYGVCGGYARMESCPCGEYVSYSYWNECNEEHISTDESGEMSIDKYYCADCDTYRFSSYTENTDRETCTYVAEYYLKLVRGESGETLFEKTLMDRSTSHAYIYSFHMQGESCEDGVTVSYACKYCGESGANEQPYYGHETYQTEHYDLGFYGMCGGEVTQSNCACGKNYDYYWHNECNWNNTGRTDENGWEEMYCSDCNTFRYTLYTSETNRENCRYENVSNNKFVRDGVTLLEFDVMDCYDSHEAVVQSIEMFGDTCEDGYIVTYQCVYCDYTYTQEYSGGHHNLPREYVDLSAIEGLCGGYIRYYSCPCGETSNVEYGTECQSMQYDSWTEEQEDGFTHNISQWTCQECDYQIVRDYYQYDDDANCKTVVCYTYNFYNGTELIASFNEQEYGDNHQYGNRVYTLAEGSADCTDGIIGIATCERCGYESRYHYNSHQTNAVEEIDLQQYGAVCETYLTKYECPCGERMDYELTGEMRCDMDQVWTEDFVPGTIDDAQNTADGWQSTYSDSYILTCAVTDPEQCAFKIRYSRYWLVDENCVATQYETWQLGYNEETGEYLHEVTIETGDKHTYHNYVSTGIRQTREDGIYEDGTLQTCSKCGSTYSYVRFYSDSEENEYLGYEEEAVNMLNDGGNKRYYHISERTLYHEGYWFETLNRHAYTYADGSEYWYQYVYEYDFENGCSYKRTYTNSNGDVQYYYDTCHNTSWSREEVEQPTCTQHGAYIERWSCDVCGTVTEEYTYEYTPTCHNWNYDYDLGCYVCSDCGLENINGATGSIAMEDLTDAYGGGTNYVVGYWNRYDLEMTQYVSVVKKTVAEGEDEEIVLSFNDFTWLRKNVDGITAVSFDKAAVAEAAAAAVAEAGYTGEYDIRFTFVPKNDESTLDYAITFGTLGE